MLLGYYLVIFSFSSMPACIFAAAFISHYYRYHLCDWIVSLPRPLCFFDIGTEKKGLVKWSVLTGDHVMGIQVNN